MEEIEPKEKKEKYTLENYDYLLIQAIRDLTKAIDKLRRELK